MAEVGNYRIIRRIAEGGFGYIYQASHILLDELACIKQNKEDSPSDIMLLKEEAKILWRLNEFHSIPGAKDFFQVGPGNFCMVMDYIDGYTLDDIVKKNSRLHPEDACWITERLLGAIYYANYNGVIHSDIKPQNVMVEEKKRDIKLIDWGISVCRPDSSTIPLGYTEAYAAPELRQGRPPIPETDIYGAGIVMLYALGGDLISRRLPKDTPKEIADYCRKLMAPDPLDRPNWNRDDIIGGLSDVRYAVFGRRHIR